jgi:hypothetical protein
MLTWYYHPTQQWRGRVSYETTTGIHCHYPDYPDCRYGTTFTISEESVHSALKTKWWVPCLDPDLELMKEL